MRKICIITGSRAEYGHMRWLAQEIADDPDLYLQFLVLGTHLAAQYGMTVDEIVADGFTIDERVETALASDTPVAVAKSMGLALTGCAEALLRLGPDIVVILGDRYEMMAAAQAALVLRIPIAHLHGGETSEGAFDEAIRHSITKMAHLHFTAAEDYRRRVIQLGENPERVFNFGTPGLDGLSRQPLMDRAALSASIGFDLSGGPLFLMTYHPVTLEKDPTRGIDALLKALEAYTEARILITGVNADTGNRQVAGAYEAFARRYAANVRVVGNLGHHRYLSALSVADLVIGNSSSGLIEAPVFNIPTINIGNRQKGRLAGPSVIHCAEKREVIDAAIRQALDPAFRASIANATPPYGRGGASPRIKDVLKHYDLGKVIMKSFHDLRDVP